MCPGHANQQGQEQTGRAQCDVFTTTPAKGSIRVDEYITVSPACLHVRVIPKLYVL